MNDIDFTKLGIIDDVQKESSILLGSVNLKQGETIPEVYLPKLQGVIKPFHQGTTSACGAFSGAHLIDLLGLANIIKVDSRRSPNYLWRRIKKLDPFKPSEGTSMEWIFKTLQTYGVCAEDLLPNDTSQWEWDYTKNSVITKEMDEDAKKYKISTYAMDWNISFDKVKEYIYKHKVIIGRFGIGKEWYRPSWKAKDILPLKPNQPEESGHFVVIYGYDKDNIYFLNSWGDTWGDKGIGYFGRDYIHRLTYVGSVIPASKIRFEAVLRVGSRGSNVSLLQKALKDLGYSIKIDGIFGQETKSRVMDFQKKYKLTVDGIVGNQTNSKLNELF